MKKTAFAFFAFLLSVMFVLSGCSWLPDKEGSVEVDACVYYIENGGTTLVEMKVSLSDASDEKKATQLVEKLLTPPDGKESPLCSGTKLRSLKIEDEIAVVDFSKEFSNYHDPKYTMSVAAVSKTLCSLEFISGINILVDGVPAVSADGTPIGIIMQNDVAGADAPVEKAKVDVVLYFGDAMGEGLTSERRMVEFPTSNIIEKIIVEELLKGPQGSQGISVIPTGVKVLSVETKNNVCFVNLSKEFIDKFSGGSTGEMLTIYSIVNSLTELDTVSAVQFLIEGEKRESLDHITLNEPIARDKSLIME